MKLYNKIVPTWFYENVKKIDVQILKQQGIKTLFFDLDNTLITYAENILKEETIMFLSNLQTDFNIVIISNSGRKRVMKALEKTGFAYVHKAYKPLKKGFKKALKVFNNEKDEVVTIGDQLMTDIFGANRFKIKSILVKPLEVKTDVWTTRLNRKIEKSFVKKLKKKNIEAYQKVIYPYENN